MPTARQKSSSSGASRPGHPIAQPLSPRQLGEALGVSESSLKRWADQGLLRVARTAGGHRRIPLEEAVRFIRAQGLEPARPSLLGIPELAPVPEGVSETGFRQALKEGGAEAVRAAVMGRYLAGTSVAEICDSLIAPAMEEVGELWHQGLEGIYVEHRATDLCLQALQHLRALLPAPDRAAPVALGGALARDRFLLSSLMAACVSESAGWRAENLGPETPPEALARAADDWGAALVWISVSAHSDVGEAEEALRALAPRVVARGARILVGGRGSRSEWQTRIEGVYVASSMREMEAFFAGLGSHGGGSA